MIRDALVVILDHLILFFKLVDQVCERWHRQFEIICFVRFLVRQIVILIWLLHDLRHFHLPVVTVVAQLYVVQLVDVHCAHVARHGFEYSDSEVAGEVVGRHLDLVYERAAECLRDRKSELLVSVLFQVAQLNLILRFQSINLQWE